MKQAISLLAAIAVAASMSVATFAADDIPGTATQPRTALVGADNTISIGINELFLVDESNAVAGTYTRLAPDTEYVYRVYYNDSNGVISALTDGKELTGQIIQGGNIRLRTIKGSSNIQSARIRTIGRGDTARYELVINTRATYGTKLNDVEYSLNVTGSKAAAGTFKESTHTFEVGYATISDDETDVGEGGYITISNDFPVITKEQFSDIAKSVNYRTVNFEGEDGGWMFTGRVSGMGDTNFYHNYDVIPELINKYPDQEYKFLNFKAGVTFPASGEMHIDVSDVYDTFDRMYTYLYRNGKLTRIDTTYDSGANEIVFRTNYLGSFVITDKEITDNSILNNGDQNTTDSVPEQEQPSTGNQNNGTSGNPNTGASDMMNIAVAMGLVSLAGAAVIARKKK